MLEKEISQVAIIDYGIGNLFSVKNACNAVGLNAVITSSKEDILESDIVILPGVGAFGNAMNALNKMGIAEILSDIVGTDKLIVGICLGAQLMMTEGYEFGVHKGLGVIEGEVVVFDNPLEGSTRLKIPHVGWNRIYNAEKNLNPIKNDKYYPWHNTLLDGLSEGEFMYFVHSYYVKPANCEIVISVSRYGQIEFCSSWKYKNIYAFQFHPERSGLNGLRIYRNLALMINKGKDC